MEISSFLPITNLFQLEKDKLYNLILIVLENPKWKISKSNEYCTSIQVTDNSYSVFENSPILTLNLFIKEVGKTPNFYAFDILFLVEVKVKEFFSKLQLVFSLHNGTKSNFLLISSQKYISRTVNYFSLPFNQNSNLKSNSNTTKPFHNKTQKEKIKMKTISNAIFFKHFLKVPNIYNSMHSLSLGELSLQRLFQSIHISGLFQYENIAKSSSGNFYKTIIMRAADLEKRVLDFSLFETEDKTLFPIRVPEAFPSSSFKKDSDFLSFRNLHFSLVPFKSFVSKVTCKGEEEERSNPILELVYRKESSFCLKSTKEGIEVRKGKHSLVVKCSHWLRLENKNLCAVKELRKERRKFTNVKSLFVKTKQFSSEVFSVRGKIVYIHPKEAKNILKFKCSICLSGDRIGFVKCGNEANKRMSAFCDRCGISSIKCENEVLLFFADFSGIVPIFVKLERLLELFGIDFGRVVEREFVGELENFLGEFVGSGEVKDVYIKKCNYKFYLV